MIQPDCLVQIKVRDDPTLDGNYSVNEIGAVEFGYVGPVILDNMTDKLAARKIKEVLDARYFRDATVEVRISRASYDKIQVGGAVNKAGLIRIGAGDSISLNDALLRAGGLKSAAKGAKLRIVRGGLLNAVAATMDGEEYSLVSEHGQPSVPEVLLRNNDLAYVFSSDAEAVAEVGEKEILVLGEVTKAGVYRFSMLEPCTIMHLVLKMNGLSEYANKKAVRVIRKTKEGDEEEFKVNVEGILEQGDPEKDFSLENGDRVIVPARRLSIF
jgi:protein involved in polysaccharide export with SLBB domain